MIKLKETTMRKTWVVCLLAMVCCALWGSAFPCIKVGYRLFQIDSADTATQILFAGCRFTIAGIMVILFGSILQGRFLKAGKGDLPRIGKICLLQTVAQYFFFYVGLAHTTGVKGSIVEASNVFLAILVSSLIFHQEKLDQKKVLGCIVGFTNPVFGVILSAIILREGNVFGMKDLIALVLVSIGILIVNWAKPVGEKEKGMN